MKKGEYEKGEIHTKKLSFFCSKKKEKRFAKKDEAFQNDFFFKKVEKTKKTGDAKGEKKSPNNNRNQKEGQGTRKMCTKKKKKNKTKRTK